jgi:hypothetical protein
MMLRIHQNKKQEKINEQRNSHFPGDRLPAPGCFAQERAAWRAPHCPISGEFRLSVEFVLSPNLPPSPGLPFSLKFPRSLMQRPP